VLDSHPTQLVGCYSNVSLIMKNLPADAFISTLPASYPAGCLILYGFLALLSLVTVCGNLLVIISVFYFKQLHTPTNTLILSLAVADLLVGMVIFPLSLFFPLSSCMYNVSLFCKIRDSFDTLLSICSIMHLCCISVDRYYAVCRSNDDELVIMLCIYLKIFLVAQKQARSIQSIKSGATASKMERKATKTLAIVLGVLFCWSPFFLFLTFQPLGNNLVPVPVIETVTWLGLSNSTLNPFIYAFFLHLVQRTFLKFKFQTKCLEFIDL
uniref:G-protein coupled receptors family 1 profile domain-containing protein n=1 Tax=Poecilia reticulata TaxID=8081 RepID=A0A3P9Q5Y6_POERE